MKSWGARTLLCVWMFAGPAAAGQGQSTPAATGESGVQTLSPITVQGSAMPPSLTQPTMAQAAATLSLVPGGTNLIDASQYETGRSSNLVDVLSNQPGIYIGSRAGTDDAKLVIRGDGLDRPYHLRGVMLLQDGIPLNEGDGNGGFQQIEMLAQQGVEVYRGGDALQYGATTMGGAINFISPTGYTAPGFRFRTEAGSYGYSKTQLAAAGVRGDFDYYDSVTGSTREGFQDHSQNRDFRLNGNAGYRFDSNVETRLYYNLVHSDLNLSGTLTKAQLLDDRRMADPSAIRFDEQHNVDYGFLADKTTFRLSDTSRLDASLYWTRQYTHHPLPWFQPFLNGLGLLIMQDDTYGADLRYTSDARLGTHDNRLVVGFRPDIAYGSNNRYQNHDGVPGAQTTSIGEKWANVSLYAENQYHLTHGLVAVAGVQFVYALRDYRDHVGGQSLGQVYRAFDPKLGLIYDVAPTVQIYASGSRSFEPPTSLETLQNNGPQGDVGTVRLNPQSAWTYVVGTRGGLSRVAWDIDYYYARVHDEFLTVSENGNPVSTLNASPTRHEGVEAGASAVLLRELFTRGTTGAASARDAIIPGGGLPSVSRSGSDRVVLRVTYDWSQFNFMGDRTFGRNQLPGIPKNRVDAALTYQHPSGFYLGADYAWVGGYPVDYVNGPIRADAYFVLGARVGYRSVRGWSLFLQGTNLTNKRYASAVEVTDDAQLPGDDAVFETADGRAVYGGVQVDFGS